MTSPEPDVRILTADQLGIGPAEKAKASGGSSAPDDAALQPDDPQLKEITRLLDQYGGVILTGPPGTSKSWLAREAAKLITEKDCDRQAAIQFHASYQFEDFMEGFRPKKDGAGFEARRGVFLDLMDKALKDDRPHVIVIDELSRADVGRVFGEALTYIEKSKRGVPFQLPSGGKWNIPMNLLIIATMNPLDRGVDDVDAAFERRFAKIEMLPDAEVLEKRLASNGVEEDLANRLLAWFRKTNSRAKQTPATAVGHAYFWDVTDVDSLRDVWEYQLNYLIDRAFKYDDATHKEVVNGWNKVVGTDDDAEAEGPGES
ncbi:McrB family protein [Mycobacteroides chelonae]|uniref:McrB family protein n=1 Tax=Mycobacteroides chelonae TaxID=1774 RepID=UPI0039EBC253